jgi:hypothetical protein
MALLRALPRDLVLQPLAFGAAARAAGHPASAQVAALSTERARQRSERGAEDHGSEDGEGEPDAE